MILLEIALAYAYSHVLEYYAHKFLHRFKKKKQFLSFHMREHHVHSKRNNMLDPPSPRELGLLAVVAAAHLPLLALSPAAYYTLLAASVEYLYVHWRAHLDLQWAERHVPWHVDHHLGNQQANWGVRRNLVDRLLRTRDARSQN